MRSTTVFQNPDGFTVAQLLDYLQRGSADRLEFLALRPTHSGRPFRSLVFAADEVTDAGDTRIEPVSVVLSYSASPLVSADTRYSDFIFALNEMRVDLHNFCERFPRHPDAEKLRALTAAVAGLVQS
jgi:hypothetical protein